MDMWICGYVDKTYAKPLFMNCFINGGGYPQGSGGQNVNKVSTAVHLRFDIKASSLAQIYKDRLLLLNDHHISSNGVIIIKAQSFRSQEKNREDTLQRLADIIKKALVSRKKRRPTKPGRAAKQRRII